MSLRNSLILLSLAANVFLVVMFQSALKRSAEARQIMLAQESEMTRLRDVSSKIKPAMGGLGARGVGLELALLQKVKLAVASQLSRNRGRELKCSKGSAGELGVLLNQMADSKKRLDILLANNQRNAAQKEEMVRKVEDAARAMKEELIAACAGRR